MRTYYRLQPDHEDPELLLDPGEQRTEPWGGTVYGRCDKCGGSGVTTHECESCASGVDPGCPKCGGQVRYEGECPACRGSGEIDDSSREGVSVFPDLDGLYRYMVSRDAELDGCVVVSLEGLPSNDEDFDADEGAMLIKPTRVLETAPLERERIERIKSELRDRTG